MSESESHRHLRESVLKLNRELRRAMSTLQGYLDSLEGKIQTAEHLGSVHRIQIEADRIVRKLSAMAHVVDIQHGAAIQREEVILPKACAEESLGFLIHDFPGLDINISVDDHLSTYVKADKDRVFDIIYGVVSLLAEQRSERVRIRLQLVQEVEEIQLVEFKVTGFNTDLSPQAFEELITHFPNGNHTLNMSTPLVFDWAMRLLKVEKLDFDIDVTTKDQLTMVFFDRWQKVEHAPDEADPFPDEESRDYHILVAEDNPLNQLVTRMMIENMGWKCDVAADGIEVCEMFDPSLHDCILMDIEMPNRDGLLATSVLRAEKGATVPIVTLTADAMQMSRRDAEQAGLNDYLVKPVKKDVLEEKIRLAIRSYRR